VSRLNVHTPTGDVASTPDAAPPARALGALLLRARDAARLCAVSLATWERWHAAGRCPAPVRIGKTVRWRADELAAWIELGCPDRKTWAALQSANGRPRQAGR
jgi:predicted DNA-binding transcriptional regulator AlpA